MSCSAYIDQLHFYNCKFSFSLNFPLLLHLYICCNWGMRYPEHVVYNTRTRQSNHLHQWFFCEYRFTKFGSLHRFKKFGSLHLFVCCAVRSLLLRRIQLSLHTTIRWRSGTYLYFERKEFQVLGGRGIWCSFSSCDIHQYKFFTLLISLSCLLFTD